MHRLVRSLTLLCLAALAGAPLAAPASAACTDLREVAKIRQELREATRCRLQALRSGGVACTDQLPATAAGVVAGAALDLAFGEAALTGPVDPGAFRDQLACQRAIARGVTSYLEERLTGLVTGADPLRVEERARRQLLRVPDVCVGVRVDGTPALPVVGGACATLIATPGTIVQAVPLEECLHGALGAAIAALGTQGGGATTTVIIVRHAERDPGEDPPLIPEGELRAERLAAALVNAGVTHILATPFIRNQQTAEPLSQATGVAVTTVPVPPPDWPGRGHVMADAVLALPRGGVIVVIGHSTGFNSAVATDLGSPVGVPETYAALNVLTMVDGAPTRLVVGTYGGPSSLDPQ